MHSPGGQHRVEYLFGRLKDIDYPDGVVPVPEKISGTAFFPGGYGLWREERCGCLPPMPRGGMMVSGRTSIRSSCTGSLGASGTSCRRPHGPGGTCADGSTSIGGPRLRCGGRTLATRGKEIGPFSDLSHPLRGRCERPRQGFQRRNRRHGRLPQRGGGRVSSGRRTAGGRPQADDLGTGDRYRYGTQLARNQLSGSG